MHWSFYVLITVAVLTVLLAIHIWRSYQLYRLAWQEEHLDELVRALRLLKAEQLSTLEFVQALPSHSTSSLGVTLGYSLSMLEAAESSDSVPSPHDNDGENDDENDGKNDGEKAGGDVIAIQPARERRVRHHLIAHAVGFFGQAMAERALTFSLMRFGFVPEQVELCITAYNHDSFHAFIELGLGEHREWAARALVPVPDDGSAQEAARDYREALGHPRQMLKTIGGLPGIPHPAGN